MKRLWIPYILISSRINASVYGVSDCGIIDSNKPIHCYELDLISMAKEHSWIHHERKECLQSGWMSRRWSTHISTFWDSSSCSLSDADQSDVGPAKRLHYVLSTVRMATGIERFWNTVDTHPQMSSDKKRAHINGEPSLCNERCTDNYNGIGTHARWKGYEFLISWLQGGWMRRWQGVRTL